MKIAFFADAFIDTIGGIRTVIEGQKAELEKRGHTVYVFSTGFPRQKSEKTRLAKKHIFLVPSCKIFFRGLAPISRRPPILEKWLIKTHPELKSFDIFYVHYEGGCSIAGLRLARKLQIPSVQVMHGREDMGETNIIPFGFRTFTAIMLHWFQSWYLPQNVKIKPDKYLANNLAKAKMWSIMVNHANYANLVLSPSRHFCEKLKFYGVKTPIKILPNGISEAYYPPNAQTKKLAPNEELQIVWHSRVSAEKRILPFLEALKDTQKPYHLDVYGGGGDYFRAKHFAKKHQLNVTFHGNAKFEIIYQKLLQSHLDVLISCNFDTFGMTLIEAAATGTPALICDPDLQEVLPRNSFILAKTPNPTDITKALNHIQNHPETIKKMSQIALRNRSKLLISHKIDQLEKYFNDIIKS